MVVTVVMVARVAMAMAVMVVMFFVRLTESHALKYLQHDVDMYLLEDVQLVVDARCRLCVMIFRMVLLALVVYDDWKMSNPETAEQQLHRAADAALCLLKNVFGTPFFIFKFINRFQREVDVVGYLYRIDDER